MRFASSCGIVLTLLAFFSWPLNASPVIPFFGNITSGVAKDSLWSSVTLLLNMDGSNASTSLVDLSPSARTATVVGNAAISTAQTKYGSGSFYVDGTDTNSGIQFPGLSFGASDWCIEFWYYFPSATLTAGTFPLFSNFNYFNGTTAAGISIHVDGPTQKINALMYTGGGNDATGATGSGINTTNAISLQQWNHVALTRQGAVLRLYLNGALQSSATNSSNTGINMESTNSYYLGRWYAFGAGAASNKRYGYGYFDDLRITKGSARYTTSSFTLPVRALPNR